MARLIVSCEGVDLLTHELAGDIIMIGRAPANHIVIDHLSVSAQHAVLLRVGASYWLKDLNSTNGTLINGALATDTELNDGDKSGLVSSEPFLLRCCKRGSKRGLEDSGRLFHQARCSSAIQGGFRCRFAQLNFVVHFLSARARLQFVLIGLCNPLIIPPDLIFLF